MKWNGRYYRPGFGIPVYPKKESSIAELLKPLGEKDDKGNVWRPILNQPINVLKVEPTPMPSASPTPTITPTLTPTPTPSPLPSYEPEYQAILNYATTQGYTQPSLAQKTLQNQVVSDLKTAGIWSNIDIFYMFATDGSSDFAKINWKNPSSYYLSTSGSMTFITDVGFTPSSLSVSNYLNTNYNLSTNNTGYTTNDASRFFWDYDNTAGGGDAYDGIALFETKNNSRAQNVATHRINANINDLNAAYNFSGVGFKMIQRTSSSNVNFYNGSATPTSRTQNSVGRDNSTQIIGRLGAGGTSARKISFYGLGASLSGLESSLYNTMNTYMTSI